MKTAAAVLTALLLVSCAVQRSVPSTTPIASGHRYGIAGAGSFITTSCSSITNPVAGQTWCFDATTQSLKVWTGAAWVVAGGGGSSLPSGPAGADLSGTYPNPTVTTVLAGQTPVTTQNGLNALAQATGNYNMNNNTLTNVAGASAAGQPIAYGQSGAQLNGVNLNGNQVSNLPAATTSGQAVAFALNHLNDLAAATGNYNMGGAQLTNLGAGFFRSVMVFSDASGPGSASTSYFSVFATHAITEGAVTTRFPIAATLKNLECTDTGAPGTGNGDAFTVRVNVASTALACSISGANTSCSDFSDTASVLQGQSVTIQNVATGTPGGRSISCQLEVDI